MTTKMNQVTCSLYDMKIDELKRKDNLISTNQYHLQLCKNAKDKIAIMFFKKIFIACPNKSKIYNSKTEETHDFWQSHFAMKLPKEKVDILLRSYSIDNSEIECSLTSDFQNFIQNTTPDLVETYFNPTDKIMICKN